MNTVIFKTGNAVFQFDQKDVKARLEILINEYGVDEAKTILKCIPFQTGETKPIQEKHDYFAYIVLELIGAGKGKGSVVCKNCGKSYRFHQLKAFTVGPDETTFKVNMGKKGGFKSLFRKKPKPFGMYGGKGYKCPEGHELIFMITWRT